MNKLQKFDKYQNKSIFVKNLNRFAIIQLFLEPDGAHLFSSSTQDNEDNLFHIIIFSSTISRVFRLRTFSTTNKSLFLNLLIHI